MSIFYCPSCEKFLDRMNVKRELCTRSPGPGQEQEKGHHRELHAATVCMFCRSPVSAVNEALSTALKGKISRPNITGVLERFPQVEIRQLVIYLLRVEGMYIAARNLIQDDPCLTRKQKEEYPPLP